MNPRFKIGDQIVLVKKPVFPNGNTVYDSQYANHIPTTITEIVLDQYHMSGPNMWMNITAWIDKHCEIYGSPEDIFYRL